MSKRAILLTFVGDRSLSTENITESQRDGLRKFINDRRIDASETGSDCFINITTFNDFSNTFTNKWGGNDFANINDLPENISEEDMDIMMSPKGLTRLIDTAYEEITKYMKKWNELKNKYEIVVGAFALSTDGIDNASEKYKHTDLNKIISEATEKGIDMIFMGANQNAIHTGCSYGFKNTHSLTYGSTNEETINAYEALSQIVRESSQGKKTKGFTRSMRNKTLSLSGMYKNGNKSMQSLFIHKIVENNRNKVLQNEIFTFENDDMLIND